MLDASLRLIRWAARATKRGAGSSAATIAILALGIGVNTAVFSFANGFLLHPPAGIAAADQLVRIGRSTGPDDPGETMAYPDYEYIRDENTVFSGVVAYDRATSPVALVAGSRYDQVDARFVSGNFFSVLGVRAAAGRLFADADDQKHAPLPLAVISAGLWERDFGRDPSIAGRAVLVNGTPFTILGVVDARFTVASLDEAASDVWIPLAMRPALTGRSIKDLVRTAGYLHSFAVVMGRLQPGATVGNARANVAMLSSRLARAYDDNAGVTALVADHAFLEPWSRRALVSLVRLLAIVAGLVLLIACANVTNLQLVRATARRREIGVRLALGASRRQIVVQLLAESVLLATIGAALGVLMAAWSMDLLTRFLPFPAGSHATLHVDLRAGGVALALAMACGVIAGLLPALRATRLELATAVKSGPGAIEGRSRLRGTLVAIQVAVTFTLLVGASLFVRTVRELQQVPLGFQPAGAIALTLNLRPYGYSDTTGATFQRALLDRVRAIPGVRSAALSSLLPLSGERSTTSVHIDGRALAADSATDTDYAGVTDGYFRTMGIPLAAGREFTALDDRLAPPVAIVSETFARTYWPTESAIGKRIRRGTSDAWIEVVGVARDATYSRVGGPPVPAFYTPMAQRYSPRVRILVRSDGDVTTLIAPIREAVRSLDARLPIIDVQTMSAVHARSISRHRTNASLVTALGLLALVLASIGVYGVMAFVVGQRTRETGVRMALGAQPSAVVRRVTAEGMRLVAMGLAVGLPCAIAASRVIAGSLFGVTTHDVASFVLAGAVLAATALIATYIPARRASRVDPLIALRSE